MNGSLAKYGLCLYALFGIFLFFQMASETAKPSWKILHGGGAFQKDRNSDKWVFRQTTKKAVINVKTVAFAEAIYAGKVKVVCNHPDSSTLFCIVTGLPSILSGEFKAPLGPVPYIESNGKVVVTNGSGIVIRSSAFFDWDEEQEVSTMKIEPDVRLVPSKEGNEYALSINKRGALRASKPMMNMRPDRIKVGEMKPAPVLKDEVK